MSNVTCLLCSKGFATPSALQAHLGTKDLAAITRHACNKCDQWYCSAVSLRSHEMTKDHTRIFKCTTCTKCYSREPEFVRHTRECSNSQPEVVKQPPSTGAKKSSAKAKSKKKQASVPRSTDSAYDMPKTTVSAYSLPKFTISAYNVHEDQDLALSDDDQDSSLSDEYRGWGRYDQGQDWTLCDKDCGWCGHCYDNYDGDL